MGVLSTGNAAYQAVGYLSSPPTYVQSAQGNAVGTSVTATFASAQASGDTNIVAFGCSISGDVSSVVDSSGNAYTLVQSGGIGLYNEYVYASVGVVAASAGANTVTVTFTASLTSFLAIAEYSGVGRVDKNSFNGGSSNASPTEALNTQAPTCIVIGVAFGNNNAVATPGSGFTARQTATDGVSNSFIFEDQTVTSTGAYNVAVTNVGAATSPESILIGLALDPIQALPTYSFTVCGFFYYGSGNDGFMFHMDDGDPQGGCGFAITLGNNTANKVSINTQEATSTPASPTLTAKTWYFVAVTWSGGATGYAYIKPVGAPTCTLMAATFTAQTSPYTNPMQIFFGCENVPTISNSAAQTQDNYWGGSATGGSALAHWKLWREQLSHDQIERESEQLTPHAQQGLWLYMPFRTPADVTDQALGNLQFTPIGSGTWTQFSDPPLPLTVVNRTVFRKRGFEESAVWTPQPPGEADSPAWQVTRDEEFAPTTASTIVDEPPPVAIGPPVDYPIPAVSVGEDLPVSPASIVFEDRGLDAVWPAVLCMPLFAQSEDFAGSLAFEEPPGFVSLALNDLPLFFTVSFEEFGLPHPQEDVATLIVLPLDAVPIVWSGPEDFAGSGPYEETAAQVVWGPDTPISLAPPVEETAPGVVPIEEPPGWRSPDIEPPSGTLVVPEDFAGSLALEETTSTGWLPKPTAPLIVAPPSEETAPGVVPIEEPPEWVAPRSESPVSIVVVPEDFAGSLVSEEVSSTGWLPDGTPQWITAPPSEDFVGTMVSEEAGAFASAPQEPPATTVLVPEDFAGSLPYEDGGLATFGALESPLWLTAVSEDFAGAMVDEPSPAWVWDVRLEAPVIAVPQEEAPGPLTFVFEDAPPILPIPLELFGPIVIAPEEIPPTVVDEHGVWQWMSGVEPAVAIALPEDYVPAPATLVDEPPGWLPPLRALGFIGPPVPGEEYPPQTPTPPPINPLLYGGGGDEDEDRDYIRFFRISHGQSTAEDERLIDELGEIYPKSPRVDMAGEAAARVGRGPQKRVTVTITINGVRYVVSRDLPGED